MTRSKAVGLFAFLLLAIGTVLRAQTVQTTLKPSNDTGVQPYGAYGGVRENINLTNGNINLEIPLVSIPGRGLNLNLKLEYDSKLWNLEVGSYDERLRKWYFGWSTEQRLAPTGHLGWHLNVPAISGGDVQEDVYGNPIYSDFLITLPDGSKHLVPSPGESYQTTDSYDASYLRFRPDPGGTEATVTMKDGTVIVFPYHYMGKTGLAKRIIDVDGNIITFSSTTTGIGELLTGVTDTLGRTVTLNYANITTSPLLTSITYKGSDGTDRTVTLASSTVSYTNVSFPNPQNTYNGTVRQPGNVTYRVLTGVTYPMPDLAYSFQYESPYGEITKVTYPTGGYSQYTYSTQTHGESHPVLSRSTSFREIASRSACADASNCSLTIYAPTIDSPLVNNSNMLVTAADGTTTEYTFTQGGLTTEEARYKIPQETSRVVKDSSGTVLRTVTTTLDTTNTPTLPTEITTTLGDSGQVTKETFAYSTWTANGATQALDNVTSHVVYDYGAGAPGAQLRKTVTTWKTDYYTSLHILTAKSMEQALDSAGAVKAQTEYFYDESGYASGWGPRAKVTTVQRWRNLPSSGYPVTHYWYDHYGHITKMRDPGGHETVFSYADNWENNSCALSGTSAYLTSITNAKGQVISGKYNSCTGTLANVTDPNSQISSFSYDALGRLTSTNAPNGAITSLAYTATTLTTTASITATLNSVTVETLDGLGRAIQSCLTSDPEGAVCTDTTYDNMGRKATVSNPHRSTPAATDGITAYRYDALGRVIKQIPPDGTESSNNVTTAYYGNQVTVTDQAGKQKRSFTDAAGQLTRVDEPGGTSGSRSLNTPWTTEYQYNALGLLTRVDQKGGETDSSKWRTRTATYNSLGQLLTSANPETGTISYAYDDDGNVTSRTQPRQNQTSPSVTVTTTYLYDELHRLTGKTYSTGDPSVSYTYDSTAGGNFGVGRQTGMTDASGSTAWTYDEVGNATVVSKTIGSVTKSFTYGYNRNGSVASLRYPSGLTLTYRPTAAGRMDQVADGSGTKYVDGVTYWPTGAAQNSKYGVTSSFGGIDVADSYNNRLQPTLLSASTQSQTILSSSYSFNQGSPTAPINNGLLMGIQNNLDSNWSKAFTYDELNRVLTAQTPSSANYGVAFTTDAWGNLLSKTALPGKNVVWSLSEQVNANNQFIGKSYDAAGNLTDDGVASYTYDAENRIASTGGVTYTYDGSGERVKKSNGMLYFSGTGSAPLLETALDGTASAEYVFFNGKRVARIDRPSGAVHYYFADHLGSTSKVTNATGTLEASMEMGAYGEVLSSSGSERYLFTGKEREAGGEDYFGARYYTFRQGRFLTPDWSATPQVVPYAKLDSPQSLNLYSYVENNPITGTDPDGHLSVGGYSTGMNSGNVMLDHYHQGVYIDQNPDELPWANVGRAAVDEMHDTRLSGGLPPSQQSAPAQHSNASTSQGALQASQGSQQELKFKTVPSAAGAKAWTVRWALKRTSAAGGWIVQEITINIPGQSTLHYWEAWQVPAKSRFTSFHGTAQQFDDMFRAPKGSTFFAKARFYEGVRLPSSFAPYNVRAAGILPSTTVNPNLPVNHATPPNTRWWKAP